MFVSILVAHAQPILALAEVRGVREGESPDEHLVHLRFQLMAPSQAARLATLLEWPMGEPPDFALDEATSEAM